MNTLHGIEGGRHASALATPRELNRMQFCFLDRLQQCRLDVSFAVDFLEKSPDNNLHTLHNQLKDLAHSEALQELLERVTSLYDTCLNRISGRADIIEQKAIKRQEQEEIWSSESLTEEQKISLLDVLELYSRHIPGFSLDQLKKLALIARLEAQVKAEEALAAPLVATIHPFPTPDPLD